MPGSTPSRRTVAARAAIALLLVPILEGCQLGPRTVPTSAAHYSDAVRIAQSEQLLVNLVRLRYRDHPVFLSVAGISTQFEFRGTASLEGTIADGSSDTLGLGGGVQYAERPTITFGILSGDSFERDMLQPIRVGTIALLAESGWRVDRVLRLTVEGMNGLRHARTASGPTPASPPEYEPFLEAVTLLQRLGDRGSIDFEFEVRDRLFSDPIPRTQLSGEDLLIAARGGIEFRRTGEGDDYQPVLEERRLVLRVHPDAADAPDVARLRSLLGLDPARDRYDIVSRDDADHDAATDRGRLTQVILDTRSLQGVLYFLSHGVRPTDRHLERGTVTRTAHPDGRDFDWHTLLVGLFRIESGSGPPTDAAVAARHRGAWFWIADDDETSKSTFLLLRHLFALQSGDQPTVEPVLTLPLGG